MTLEFFNQFIWGWIAIGVITFIALLFITAPYGRHTKNGWGPLVDNRIAWVVMEAVVLVALFYFIITGSNSVSLVNGVIIALFSFHYFNRSFIFPFRIKTNGKKMPSSIMLMSVMFNSMNGFLIGYYLGDFKVYENEWLSSPQFIIGTCIFFLGMALNWSSDTILINLRKPGETGYKIPTKGFFKYVSCPNLLGEVIEWGGFAILTWSLPGLAFFVWTCANLIPRAIAHHSWYKEKFDNYPKDRKAVIPGIW